MDQSDPDFELIIINDASSDNSHAVMQNHVDAINDARVKYLASPERAGLAATRNRGINKAAGEWVAFINSDDVYHPDFLRRMHLETKNTVDVVACAHDVLLPDGRHRYRSTEAPGPHSGGEMLIKLMEDRMFPYAWGKLFRAEIAKRLTFPMVDQVEDTGFSAAAFKTARTVAIIPDVLYLHTANKRSITWGAVPPISESYEFLEFLKNNTLAHVGTQAEQNAFSVSWVLTFLNSAQAALRLKPANAREHIAACRQALRFQILKKCFSARPEYCLAGLLLRTSPRLYALTYNRYVEYMYRLNDKL